MRLGLIGLGLLACSGSAPPLDSSESGGDSSPDSGDTPTTDSSETGSDTGNDVPDTGEMCSNALQIQVEEAVLLPGDTLRFPSAPALGEALEIVLELHNTCEQELRFLGFPEDWIEGSGFRLGELPPILLSGHERSQMSLSFQPDEQGDYQGAFSLPYDRPGAPFELSLTAEVSAPLRLVLVGDGFVAVSSDYGETVQEVRFTEEVHSNAARRGVCWGLNQFVATGGSDQRMIWTSSNGEDWTEVNQGGGWIADCAASADRVVAAGGFHTITSTSDGVNWSTGGSIEGEHIRSVAHLDGVFVAIGGTEVSTSTDGLTWDRETTHGAPDIDTIAAGNGAFVGVGEDGYIVSSQDYGETWGVALVGESRWTSILFGNGAFFIGDGSTLYRSSDGVTWELVNTTGGVTPRAIVGETLLGSSASALHRSDDGGFSWVELAQLSEGGGYNDAVLEGQTP